MKLTRHINYKYLLYAVVTIQNISIIEKDWDPFISMITGFFKIIVLD